MSKPEPDYSNTVIYKIACKDPNVTDLYIGHTTDFVQRKKGHRYNSNCNDDNGQNNCKLYKVIRANGGWDNWEMVMLEFFKCNNCIEARQKEQEYYERLKPSLNSVPPFVIQTKSNNVIKKPDNVIKKPLPGIVSCNRCYYETINLGDLKRHLQRTHPCKPDRQDVDLSIQFKELFFKEVKDFKCKYCDKSYNHQQGRSRHQLKCKSKDCKKSDGNTQPADNQHANTIDNNNNNNNNINTINGFGCETIDHVTNHPDFIKIVTDIITNNTSIDALIKIDTHIRREPGNQNLSFDKPNSRYITTHDPDGNRLKKTITKCYNNSMMRIRELIIKYLELSHGAIFTNDFISKMNIIKRGFYIHVTRHDICGYNKDEQRELKYRLFYHLRGHENLSC